MFHRPLIRTLRFSSRLLFNFLFSPYPPFTHSTLVNISFLQISQNCAHKKISAGQIGGDRDVVDVADAQEGCNVWFVRLGGQGIPQEDDEVDFASGDASADLLVAAQGAG